MVIGMTLLTLVACGGGGGGSAATSGGQAGYTPVTVSANVSDDVGVVRVKFLLNESVVCDLPTSTGAGAVNIYSCQVTPVQGVNAITVQAIDAAGNVGTETINVTGA